MSGWKLTKKSLDEINRTPIKERSIERSGKQMSNSVIAEAIQESEYNDSEIKRGQVTNIKISRSSNIEKFHIEEYSGTR